MTEKQLEGEYLAISEVLEDEQDALLAKENVVGVGVGHKIKEEKDTGKPCLTVFVSQKLDPDMIRVEDMIPETVGKFKTDVVETGEIFAENLLPPETEQEEVGIEVLRGRLRPVEGGYSIGHYRITAGTYATAVYDALGPIPAFQGSITL